MQAKAIIEYPIPLSIRAQLDRNQDERDQLVRFSSSLVAQSTFAAMLTERAPGALKPPSLIWINSQYSGLTLNIFVTVPGFTTEAAPRLAEFLEFASEYYENPPVSRDNANSSFRTYAFNADPKTSNRPALQVFAELRENSENCQRIVTGTRKAQKLVYVEVDEPTYAFKC